MSVLTVRLNEVEAEMFNSYSELTGIPMSTLFKEALREKIEDHLDLQAGLKALENLSGETTSLSQMIEEFDNE